MRELSKRTGRATIIYATAWLEHKQAEPEMLSVNLGDVQGFMEAASNAEERELDLFLHSPGGSAEAAESILEYLRTQFDHIRVVVPVAAMSAATMLALGADELIMGHHSQLGPIDPQFTVYTPEGPRSAPADAIKEQFRMARDECAADPAKLAAWLPILRMYGPGLLAQCEDQIALSKELVSRWLERYMFAGDADAGTKAADVAAWFSDYPEFRSHGRRVSKESAEGQGLKVIPLEGDPELQDAILSVHHAVRHTLSGTPTVKIIENQHGRAFLEMSQQVLVRRQEPDDGQERPALAPAPTPNRETRRRSNKRRR